MKNLRLIVVSMLFVLLLTGSAAAYAQDACSKLTEDEVASAVGVPLKRSPTDPCRFGTGMHSFTIILHRGYGPQFDGYIAHSRQEFKDTQTVPGIGSDAISFGGGTSLAVKVKGDVVFIMMLLGKSPSEKIALSKAVVQKLISHL